jgi:predicted transcriptional regulator
MEVNFAPEIERKIAHAAAQHGRNSTEIVQEIVARYFEKEQNLVEAEKRGETAPEQGAQVSHKQADRRLEVLPPIRRSDVPGVIAIAARNAGEAILDAQTGALHDFSKSRDEVLFKGVFSEAKRSPPEWVHDRAAVWNAVVAAEDGEDALTAQEIVATLPDELTELQCTYVVKDFVRASISRNSNRLADVTLRTAPAIASGEDKSPARSVHILIPLRKISSTGFGERTAELAQDEIERLKLNFESRVARELQKTEQSTPSEGS